MGIGYTCNDGKIELLFATIVLGTIASIALPSFVGAQDKARNASVVSNLATVTIGIQRYAADHGGAYPEVEGPRELIAVLTQPKGYLPENRIPRSPWRKASQERVIPADRVPVQDPPGWLHGAGEGASVVGTSLGDGVVADHIGGSPEEARKYGALSYHRAGTRYVLYGTGKRGKNAQVVGFLVGGAVRRPFSRALPTGNS